MEVTQIYTYEIFIFLRGLLYEYDKTVPLHKPLKKLFLHQKIQLHS
jgi:hypothetical protein